MKRIILSVSCILIMLLATCFMTGCKKKTKTFTVTFMDGEVVLKTEQVEEGKNAIGLTPEKVGYTFTGWSESIENITCDKTVSANFTINTYTVTFKDGETVLKTETVEHGKTAIGLTPEKVGYTFTGWSESIENITCDKTVSANFTINTYTVTFKDGETVLKTETVEHGKAALGLTPEKDGYTFTGWSESIENVTTDLTVFAQFSTNTYTVTFMDEDEVLKIETVEYGKSAIGLTPSKEGYTFIGWSDSVENVTTDLTVYAQYSIIVCTVTFYVDGEVYATKTCNYGGRVVAPTRPRKPGHEFIEWDGNFKNVTSDLTINAVFEKYEYVVSFYDFDGKLIKTENVKYEEPANPPVIEDTEFYEFTGWDKEFLSITDDLDIYAVGNKIKGRIEYYFGEEKLDLSPTSYAFGDTTMLPVPEKDGYYFVGWFLSDISLTPYTEIDADSTADYILQAKFVETEKQNLIKLEETEYHFSEITKIQVQNSNLYVYQPIMPSGVPASKQAYDWSTSDSSIATVSTFSSITINKAGYCILTATNKENPSLIINAVIKTTLDNIYVVTEAEANTIELCDVTFVGKDGEIIGTTKCHKGGNVIYPAAPVYVDYKFIGWDKQNYNITENTTITAQYEFGFNKFTGKSFAVIGDSISTYLNYIPDGFKYFYPYPTADVSDVNMTWWMQVINKMGGTLFVNNSYSGSCVADTSINATKNMERLEYTTINGEAPDVILIYMGSNDCASGFVTSQMFDKGYSEMLQNLQQLCPNSEIILMTLLSSAFYDSQEQQTYNDIIKTKAKDFNLQVLDCSSASLAGHLVDSAHPNYSGMQVLANKVIEELNKIA